MITTEQYITYLLSTPDNHTCRPVSAILTKRYHVPYNYFLFCLLGGVPSGVSWKSLPFGFSGEEPVMAHPHIFEELYGYINNVFILDVSAFFYWLTSDKYITLLLKIQLYGTKSLFDKYTDATGVKVGKLSYPAQYYLGFAIPQVALVNRGVERSVIAVAKEVGNFVYGET